MHLRTATPAALPADEDAVADPAPVVVADARNEILVLEDGGKVVGCLQATYIPGLGKHGAERTLIEAVRVRTDRRAAGSGGS